MNCEDTEIRDSYFLVIIMVNMCSHRTAFETQEGKKRETSVINFPAVSKIGNWLGMFRDLQYRYLVQEIHILAE